MKLYSLFFCSFLLLLKSFTAAGQQLPDLKIENGVSQALADYRKKTVSQVQYVLAFTLPENRTKIINGEETIRFHLKYNSKPLQLDFNGDTNQIKKLTANGKQIVPSLQNEHLVINAQALKCGSNTIHINFEAGALSLNRNNEFLYTLLVPDRARTVFPCFDQPNLKATFQLSLNIPQHWIGVANAPIIDSTVTASGKTYQFKESDLFSTYLFSFVAGNFSVVNKKIEGKDMRLYHRETDSSKMRLSIDTIFGLHGLALRFLKDYTQIPYPYQKMDFAAIPDFQYGGMEHVGAIDYKASSLFLDSGATKDQENARSNVIAHETAHMWFGDLVTMQWFNDVWMKEVFANFMADKITQDPKDNTNYQLRFLLTHYPRAYSIDRTAGANPIRQRLPNLKEAGNLYGPIIYNKAPIMMMQLERLMGADAFKNGLRTYLKEYSYGNATWPDLISILDNLTKEDLQAWNKVWVNTPGRPMISYAIEQKENKITKLILTQKGERTTNYVLPQLFEIALIYPDTIRQLTVTMNAAMIDVKAVKNLPTPLCILFNSSGQGYGLFPIDKSALPISQLRSPVMRAAAYINRYENMLSGRSIEPSALLTDLLQTVQQGKEPEELILNMIASHISEIYWRYTPESKRRSMAAEVEKSLWRGMQQEAQANKKKILFRTYQNIALSDSALNNLYIIWKNQKPPTGIQLSEEEYTTLALNLTVKRYPADSLLIMQMHRISNPDRKQRLQFLLPVTSPNQSVRDSFFASLKDPKVRKKESWVADALGYLHHPLHSSSSIKYLNESLELLQQIQMTGDIFFPAAWLNATFSGYQSKEAAAIIRGFLQKNPHYNEQLKLKILQAADPVFRAEKLTRVP